MTRARRRVFEEWEEFRRQVVRNDPPEEVLLAIKMGFYAGISVYQRILRDLSATDESTPGDVQMLEDIVHEVNDFADEMKALAFARDGVRPN